MDDMNDDIHLKPENIEFLLPRDIFDELFVEKPRAKLFESLSVNVDLGSQEEITAQDEILLHDSFLQARAIINELFLEKPTESLLESLRGTVNKDIWKEIFAQAVNFAQDSSTHIVLNDEVFPFLFSFFYWINFYYHNNITQEFSHKIFSMVGRSSRVTSS